MSPQTALTPWKCAAGGVKRTSLFPPPWLDNHYQKHHSVHKLQSKSTPPLGKLWCHFLTMDLVNSYSQVSYTKKRLSWAFCDLCNINQLFKKEACSMDGFGTFCHSRGLVLITELFLSSRYLHSFNYRDTLIEPFGLIENLNVRCHLKMQH